MMKKITLILLGLGICTVIALRLKAPKAIIPDSYKACVTDSDCVGMQHRFSTCPGMDPIDAANVKYKADPEVLKLLGYDGDYTKLSGGGCALWIQPKLKPVCAEQLCRLTSIAKSQKKTLVEAAQYGDTVVVQDRLDTGAPVDQKDPATGATALMWAIHNGHLDTAKVLLNRGADIHARDGKMLLAALEAVKPDIEVIGFLLDCDCDPNVAVSGGKTALALAEQWHLPEVVKLLTARGAKADIVPKVSAAGTHQSLSVPNGRKWLDGFKK